MFTSSLSTGPPGDQDAFHFFHRNAIATQLEIRFRRTAFCQSLKSKVRLVAAKAAALRINLNISRRLWRSRTPTAHFFTRSTPSPQTSLTRYSFPPRSLVRDGQTSPSHQPRLVVSHSTRPPLSPSSHANSFVIGPAVTYLINNNIVPLCH